MTELELLFISPEGQILDTLHRGNAISPTAITLPSGIFVTYYEFNINQQILIWADVNGTITREDTLALTNIAFVYAAGSQAILVEYNPHQEGAAIVIDAVLHPFASDGTPQNPVTLYHETLADGWFNSTPAFDYTNGELRMLVTSVQPTSSPVEYSLRLVIHAMDFTIAHDPFDPGPLPVQRFAAYWNIAPGPWGTSVIGFVVSQTQGEQQVWIEGMDANGQSTGLLHIEPMPENEACNSVDVLVDGGTVYAVFTTAPLPGGVPGGAFLFALPQEEVLAAEDNFIPHPLSFILSSYPNPFNAVAQLEYELTATAPVNLTIFDISGREVATLVSGTQNAGRHQVTWNAEQQPSGVYLVRLNAGDKSVTREMVLLK